MTKTLPFSATTAFSCCGEGSEGISRHSGAVPPPSNGGAASAAPASFGPPLLVPPDELGSVAEVDDEHDATTATTESTHTAGCRPIIVDRRLADAAIAHGATHVTEPAPSLGSAQNRYGVNQNPCAVPIDA